MEKKILLPKNCYTNVEHTYQKKIIQMYLQKSACVHLMRQKGQVCMPIQKNRNVKKKSKWDRNCIVCPKQGAIGSHRSTYSLSINIFILFFGKLSCEVKCIEKSEITKLPKSKEKYKRKSFLSNCKSKE